MLPERRKTKWDLQLQRMADEFTTNEWLNVCGDRDVESVTDATAYRWLKEIVAVGMAEKLFHGNYRKTELKFYKEDSQE